MPRPNANQRGYNWRWRKARERFLDEHPLCEICRQQGRLVKATVVDHIIRHEGDERLFWDENNWQPLCKACHDSKTAYEERGAPPKGSDINGNALGIPPDHWK